MRAFGVQSLPRGLLAALAMGLLLAGCGSAPKPAADRPSAPRPALPADRDGPGANPPPDLASLPDAEPRIETIRPGGANKPYSALGRDYVPITRDSTFTERGLASWYGRKFHGRRTASGETYDMYAMTAAHPTLPIPSYARIKNPANGREVVVRVNDRGPFHAGRIVDLSYAAALRLDLLRGVAPVELERLTFDEIRAGSWRRGDSEATRLASAAPRGPAATSAAVAARGAVAVPAPDLVPVASLPAENADEPVAVPAQALASLAPALSAAAPAGSRGFWVQLGAFRESAGAESFQRRVGAEVDWLAPRLATFGDAALFRVQAGPYASRDEAQGAAARVREAIGLVPLIVERH
jgi:rare lipoprotein A